jgi:tetratricopeptide (TPR) repeat protein
MMYSPCVAWCGLLLLYAVSGVTLVSAGPIGITAPKPTSSAEAAYRRGFESLSKGDLSAAGAAFKESAQLEPKAVQPLLGLAEVALKQQAPKQAEVYLQQALNLAPQSVEVQTAWGRYLYQQQRFNDAEAAFKKAIALAPQAVALHVDLGDLYLGGLHKPQEAIDAYRAALQRDPAHAGAHYALGTALAATGDVEAAQAELTEANRLAPNNPLPLQALGQLYTARQEYEKALEAFANALKVQPQFVRAYIARGDVYGVQGQPDKALAEYNESLRVAPKFVLTHLKIGTVYAAQARPEEAQKAYLAAIDADPKQSIAYNNLAWMAAERKTQLDDALTWAKKAVELEPKVSQFQDTLGWVHRARGELDKAADVLQKATKIEPHQAVIWYHLGIIQAERKKTKDAAAALKQALQSQQNFPESEDARKRLAELEKKP